jgi:hypothetical protein
LQIPEFVSPISLFCVVRFDLFLTPTLALVTVFCLPAYPYLPEEVYLYFFPLFLALDFAYVFVLVSSPLCPATVFRHFQTAKRMASCMEHWGGTTVVTLISGTTILLQYMRKKRNVDAVRSSLRRKPGPKNFVTLSLEIRCLSTVIFHFFFEFVFSQRVSPIFLEFPFLLYFFILDGEGKLIYSVLFYSISSLVFQPISLSSF